MSTAPSEPMLICCDSFLTASLVDYPGYYAKRPFYRLDNGYHSLIWLGILHAIVDYEIDSMHTYRQFYRRSNTVCVEGISVN